MTRKSHIRRSMAAAILLVVGAAPAAAQAGSGTRGEPGTVGTLVVAHGGTPEWNAPVLDIAARAPTGGPVEVSFLMGKTAKDYRFQDAVARLVEHGATRVVVVPLLASSHSGHYDQIRYLAGELPALDEEMMRHLDMSGITCADVDVPIRVTPALDASMEIATILAERALKLAESPGEQALFIVGHGPNTAENYADWMANLRPVADSVARLTGFRDVKLGLVRDGAPDGVRAEAVRRIREVIALQNALTGRDVVVVPLLISKGGVTDKIGKDLDGLPVRYDGEGLLPHPALAEWIARRVAEATEERATASRPSGRVAPGSGAAGGVGPPPHPSDRAAPSANLAPGRDGSGSPSSTAADSRPPQEAGDIRVDVGGYGSVRYEASDAEGAASSFTMRRFVVTTDASFGSRFRVYSEVEYERLQEIEVERGATIGDDGVTFGQEVEGQNGGAIELEQAWGEFRVAEALGLRFGVVLPPVGRFNLRHDDNLWNVPQRPLIDRAANVLPAASAWREMGLGATGQVPVGRTGQLSYEAYLVNGVQLDFALDQKIEAEPGGGANLVTEAEVSPAGGAFDGSNRADAVTGRVAFSPALGSEIALSGYLGRYTPDFVARSQTLSTVGVDGRQKFGPAYVEGEFLYSRFGGLEQAISDFATAVVNHSVETEGEPGGLTSEAEVELKGLSRSRYGFWLDLGVPVALPRGSLGLDKAVLTPLVRYERVRLQDNLEEMDFAGGVVTDRTLANREQGRLWLGLAFRPVPQAVVHLAYRRDDAIRGAMLAPAVSQGSTNALLFGLAFGF